jgi:hypothetical protein
VQAHTRVEFLYLFGAIAVVIASCTLFPSVHRYSRAVSLAYALALVVALVWYARTIPHGLAVAAASFTALSMG